MLILQLIDKISGSVNKFLDKNFRDKKLSAGARKKKYYQEELFKIVYDEDKYPIVKYNTYIICTQPDGTETLLYVEQKADYTATKEKDANGVEQIVSEKTEYKYVECGCELFAYSFTAENPQQIDFMKEQGYLVKGELAYDAQPAYPVEDIEKYTGTYREVTKVEAVEWLIAHGGSSAKASM